MQDVRYSCYSSVPLQACEKNIRHDRGGKGSSSSSSSNVNDERSLIICTALYPRSLTSLELYLHEISIYVAFYH